jgi:hypothetical protein
MGGPNRFHRELSGGKDPRWGDMQHGLAADSIVIFNVRFVFKLVMTLYLYPWDNIS